MTHIGMVIDGAIVQFPHSARYFMKVCDSHTGTGGVVDIFKVEFIPTNRLESYGLGMQVEILAETIDEFFQKPLDI